MNERIDVGIVSLSRPLKIDALGVGQKFFPCYKTAAMSDGSVYIAGTWTDHGFGQTVLFFSEPSSQGFRSLYSPLTPAELLSSIERAFAYAPGGFLARWRAQRVKKQLLNAIGLQQVSRDATEQVK